MKKLLVMLMIFGIATVANAGLIELSVGGLPAPDEITLMPSDEITLDVMIGDTLFNGGDIVIQLSNDQGELLLGGWTFINPVPTIAVPGYPPFDMPWEGPWQLIDSTPQWALFSGGNITNNTQGPYVLLDNIVFHCLEATDLVIELIAGTALTYKDVSGDLIPIYEQGALVDSIIVHQIPEPATLALLGLGGLFLRRRRK